MKFCFIEEVSPRLTHRSDNEMRDLVRDEGIFVFPMTNKSAQERSIRMSLVLHLRRIYILFAFNHVTRN